MRSDALQSFLFCLPTVLTVTTSPKRGLIYIPNSTFPSDNAIWGGSGSDLTWYYNYKPTPAPAPPSTTLQFVPMMWGAPAISGDTTFLTTVQSLLSSGQNITHVLGFNEPDGTSITGGSNVSPAVAAQLWKSNIEPLKARGVKLGAPAVTGSDRGLAWLQNFFTACNGACSADFLPIHYYGNFGGLASYMGRVNATYPNMTMWITEYALDNQDLASTQSFFNMSMEYFDRLDFVKRYSYFGSFRSSSSNVGPNPAMLGSNGSLTDIGLWYLGMSGKGVVPSSTPSGASMLMSNIAWLGVGVMGLAALL